MNKIKRLCLLVLTIAFVLALFCALSMIADRTKVAADSETEISVAEKQTNDGGIMPLAELIKVEPIVFTLDEGCGDAERTVISHGDNVSLTGMFTNNDHLLTFSPFLTADSSSSSKAYTVNGTYYDSVSSRQGTSSINRLPKNLDSYTTRTYTYTFEPERGYCWDNGSTESFTLTVSIQLREVALPLPGEIKGGDGTENNPFYIETEYTGTSPEMCLQNFDSEWLDVVDSKNFGEFAPVTDETNRTVTVKSDSSYVDVCDNDKSSCFYVKPKFNEVVFNDNYSGLYTGQSCPVYFCIVITPLLLEVPVLEGVEGGEGNESDPYYVNHVYDTTVPAITVRGIDEQTMDVSSFGSAAKLTVDGSTLTYSSGIAGVYDYCTNSEKNYVKIVPKDVDSTGNYAWSDGTYSALFYTINTVTRKISVPKLVVSGTGDLFDPIYTGTEIAFEIVDWESLSLYLEFSDGSDELVQTEVGKYSVTVKIKDEVSGNVTWSDGSTEACKLLFEIVEKTEPVPVDPEVIKIEPPAFVEGEKNFSGSALTFEISDWERLSQYLEMAEGSDSLTQTNVGTYTVTLKFKDGANASWVDGGTENYSLTFTIVEKSSEEPSEPDEPPKPDGPSRAVISGFVLNDVTYGDPVNPAATSSHGTVEFTYLSESDGVFTSAVPKNAGTYYVKASVADGNGYLGTQCVIAFKILPREITVTVNAVGSVYGAELKELTATVTSGSIVAGDKPYVLTTNADKYVVGKYEITGTCTDDNYDITFVSAEYSVNNFTKIKDVSGNGEIDLASDTDFDFGLSKLESDVGFSQLSGIRAGYLVQLWYVDGDGGRGNEFDGSVNCELALRIPAEIIDEVGKGGEIDRGKLANGLQLYYVDEGNSLKTIENFRIEQNGDSWAVRFNYDKKFSAQIVMNVSSAFADKIAAKNSMPGWIWAIIGIGGASIAGGGASAFLIIKKKRNGKEQRQMVATATNNSNN